jgi:hypothetical protein
MENKENQHLYDRLIKLADLMESNADDPQFLKQLNREYKAISKQLFPKTKEHELPAYKIKETREKALKRIKEYLEVEDVERQFEDRNGDYYSNDKFIVAWAVNYKGFPYQMSIDKVDDFYSKVSGARCIVARRSLISETQLKAYSSFERALVEEGLKLCRNKEEKKQFFDKYAVAYNNRLKQKKDE